MEFSRKSAQYSRTESRAATSGGPAVDGAPATLLGIAVDVSGSMRQSTSSTGHRLEALCNAVLSLRSGPWVTEAADYQQEAGTHAHVFAYVFGMRCNRGGGSLSAVMHSVIDALPTERAKKQTRHARVDGATAVWQRSQDPGGYTPVACDVLSLITVARQAVPPEEEVTAVPGGPAPAVDITAVDITGDGPLDELGRIAHAHGRAGWELIAAEYLTEPGQVANAVARLRRAPELAEELAKLTPPLSSAQVALVLEYMRADTALEQAQALKHPAGLAAARHLGNPAALARQLRLVRKTMLQMAAPPQHPVSAKGLVGDLRKSAVALLAEAVEVAGDITLPLDAALELIEASAGRTSLFEEYAYGLTPMRQALSVVADRFERELSRASAGTRAVLLLFTDGAATDGDPGFVFSRIAQLGVTVVVCYLTDRDLSESRVLYGTTRDSWDKSARMLFENASVLSADHPIAAVLAAAGWEIEPDARCFFQGNHPDLIARIVASAARWNCA